MDVFINNAGIGGENKPELMIDVNYVSTMIVKMIDHELIKYNYQTESRRYGKSNDGKTCW